MNPNTKRDLKLSLTIVVSAFLLASLVSRLWLGTWFGGLP